MCIYVQWDTPALMYQHGERRKSNSSVWQSKLSHRVRQSTREQVLHPSSFQDFIILKINVKFTEKLSSVLLLNLEILQHQVITPFVRETKLAAPFCITTYKVKNSDKTFQTYELKTEQGTLFLSTFPTKQKKLTMRISALDGDREKECPYQSTGTKELWLGHHL